ncbi:hypothetical protein [Fluviispira multicolorata]|uniref:Uncharacterized protein n=1 Tax=Fluviispira multicolorata TaxID=2654512 RepID=A0A833JCR6_9BACT|nr:hypothetical protein [Fluviispira multicolorata]KAB8029817.1 hypothetical protein GCL57_09770 [Fluviispira multicolorata]
MKLNYLFIPMSFCISLSSAAYTNLLKCDYDEQYKTACRIEPLTLSENDPFQMDYLVKYEYVCDGHNFRVGAQTETGYYDFKRDNAENVLTATGQARLVIQALDPEKLYYKVLQKNCSVLVKEFNRRPSVITLTQWNQNVKMEIALLYSMLDNFKLGKNLDDIDKWDLNKLNLLKSNIQKLTNVYPLNLNFKALLHTLEGAIKNRPPKIEISNETKVELSIYYRTKLEVEMENATRMLEIFKQWNVVLEKDLSLVLEEIKNYIN